MTVALFMNDEKEPLSVCEIKSLYKFYGGEWAHVRWYIYRGKTPYPQGIFRIGVDHTALDNVPLTRFRDMDPIALVHWSGPEGDYPVLTRSGKLAHHVRKLALHDVRMQKSQEILSLFDYKSK